MVNKWPPLEAFMLSRSFDYHQQPGGLKDKEWRRNALTFLKLRTIVGGPGGPRALDLSLSLSAEFASADGRKACTDKCN